MKVIITGGTGLIGRELTKVLQQNGHEVSYYSRSARELPGIKVYQWDPLNGSIDEQGIYQNDALIHLAGENIADGRWSESRKKQIIESRTKSCQLLGDALSKSDKTKHAIFASAIGYYGDRGSEVVDEDSPPGNGFLAETTQAWEEASKEAGIHTRTAIVRIGVVFDNEEGALPKMAMPVKMFAGAVVGSGKQYVPWIHIQDIAGIIAHLLENEQLTGIFNGVAPESADMKKVTEQIGKTLNRPVFLPNVPGFVLKTLLGEMSQLVLTGANVSADKIQQSGYKFRFGSLDNALNDLLSD